MDYEIRTYEDGDEEKIMELLKVVFDGCRSIDFWDWQYKQNADGFYPNLIVLAVDGGKIIGHYSDLPFRAKVGDEVLLIGQPMATATHPDYRRMGIFENIAKRTYFNAGKNGIPITYGFAEVSPVYEGYIKKLGWHHVCFLVNSEMAVDEIKATKRHFKDSKIKIFSGIIGNILKLRNRLKTTVKVPDDIHIRRIYEFDDRINDYWKEFSNQYDIILVKDKKFFDWRLKCPERNYDIFIAEKDNKMIGYMITCVGDEDVRIADISALQNYDEIIVYLVVEAIKYTKNWHRDMLRCTLPEEHHYLKLLKKLGFFITTTKMAFITRLNEENDELNDRISKLRNWYITEIDSDHV